MIEEIRGAAVVSPETTPEEAAKARRDDAHAIAALVRSWDTARERGRIQRGQPLPGSLRPAPKAAKAKPATTAEAPE